MTVTYQVQVSPDNPAQLRVVPGTWAVEYQRPGQEWKQVEQGQSYADAVNLVEVARMALQLAELRVEVPE